MSKYKQLISEARKTDNKNTRKPENKDSSAVEPDVNLSIKVNAARRRHWAAEAKRRGTTLTAAITEALSDRFGEPSEQISD
jgi:hypothetical protein